MIFASRLDSFSDEIRVELHKRLDEAAELLDLDDTKPEDVTPERAALARVIGVLRTVVPPTDAVQKAEWDRVFKEAEAARAAEKEEKAGAD